MYSWLEEHHSPQRTDDPNVTSDAAAGASPKSTEDSRRLRRERRNRQQRRSTDSSHSSASANSSVSPSAGSPRSRQAPDELSESQCRTPERKKVNVEPECEPDGPSSPTGEMLGEDVGSLHNASSPGRNEDDTTIEGVEESTGLADEHCLTDEQLQELVRFMIWMCSRPLQFAVRSKSFDDNNGSDCSLSVSEATSHGCEDDLDLEASQIKRLRKMCERKGQESPRRRESPPKKRRDSLDSCPSFLNDFGLDDDQLEELFEFYHWYHDKHQNQTEDGDSDFGLSSEQLQHFRMTCEDLHFFPGGSSVVSDNQPQTNILEFGGKLTDDQLQNLVRFCKWRRSRTLPSSPAASEPKKSVVEVETEFGLPYHQVQEIKKYVGWCQSKGKCLLACDSGSGLSQQQVQEHSAQQQSTSVNEHVQQALDLAQPEGLAVTQHVEQALDGELGFTPPASQLDGPCQPDEPSQPEESSPPETEKKEFPLNDEQMEDLVMLFIWSGIEEMPEIGEEGLDDLDLDPSTREQIKKTCLDAEAAGRPVSDASLARLAGDVGIEIRQLKAIFAYANWTRTREGKCKLSATRLHELREDLKKHKRNCDSVFSDDRLQNFVRFYKWSRVDSGIPRIHEESDDQHDVDEDLRLSDLQFDELKHYTSWCQSRAKAPPRVAPRMLQNHPESLPSFRPPVPRRASASPPPRSRSPSPCPRPTSASNRGDASPRSAHVCLPLDPPEGCPPDSLKSDEGDVDAQGRKDSLTMSDTGSDMQAGPGPSGEVRKDSLTISEAGSDAQAGPAPSGEVQPEETVQVRKDSLTISEAGSDTQAAPGASSEVQPEETIDVGGTGDATPERAQVSERTSPERTPEPHSWSPSPKAAQEPLEGRTGRFCKEMTEELSPTRQRDEAGPLCFHLSRQASGDSDDAQISIPPPPIDEDNFGRQPTAELDDLVTVVWQADSHQAPHTEAEHSDLGATQTSQPMSFMLASEDTDDSDYGVSQKDIDMMHRGHEAVLDEPFGADRDAPSSSAAVSFKSLPTSSCENPEWRQSSSTRTLSDKLANAAELPVRARVSPSMESPKPLPALQSPGRDASLANDAQSFTIPAKPLLSAIGNTCQQPAQQGLRGMRPQSSWGAMLQMQGDNDPQTPPVTPTCAKRCTPKSPLITTPDARQNRFFSEVDHTLDDELETDSPNSPPPMQMPSSSFHSATGAFHSSTQMRQLPNTFCASSSSTRVRMESSHIARDASWWSQPMRMFTKFMGPQVGLCSHSCHAADEDFEHRDRATSLSSSATSSPIRRQF